MDNCFKTLTLLGSTKFERTLSLINTHLHSDFEIEVDSLTGNVTTYKVHKCFLAIVSPVWERNIQWVEGKSMKITGFPLDVISCLLIYAYTNSIQFHTLEFCLEVKIAADYFCIENISTHCIDYIKNIFSTTALSISDFILVFNLASLFCTRGLIELCIAYIEDNPDYVFMRKEFTNLTLASIKYIIFLNNYLYPEFRFIQSVLDWCLAQIPASNLREFLIEKGIIGALRFRILSIGELLNLFRNYPTAFSECEKIEMTDAILENKSFSIDHVTSIVSHRGGSNVINDDEIIILTPPVVITEEFNYVEGDNVIPIVSIEIEPRNNSFFSSFTKRYEESISISIANYINSYKEILENRNGTTLNIPFEINIVPKQVFEIVITLKSPGIYKKNHNFLPSCNGLLRTKKGLVRSINNFGKNLFNSQEYTDN